METMKSPLSESEMRRQIVSKVREIINTGKEKFEDDDVFKIIENIVLTESEYSHVGFREKQKLVHGVFNSTRKNLDILQPLIEESGINEIMVNGKDSVFIEKNGSVIKTDLSFDSVQDLEEVIMRIAAGVHREINELNPILDARLKDGSRVHAVYKNIALNGPILTIRKFPESRITMKSLISSETISEEAAVFMRKLVAAGYNIFISGGTSSGKTTFLNVLSDFIPKDERVIVIEDSAELQISGIDNIVRLETKNANVQGKGEISMRNLIKASLRMRPDRIVVGEVRGAEASDMIQAMNTGHDGSISTGHANSPEGMLNRLETMILTAAPLPLDAIRAQIASALDIIVHLGRMKDKTRRVLEISELTGYENGKLLLNSLYKFSPGTEGKKGCLERTENQLQNIQKLKMRGME